MNPTSIDRAYKTAASTQQQVQKTFENVRALDNNPLLDRDDRVGHVSLAVDTWTASASFESDGKAIEFLWKSSVPNPYASSDLDPSNITRTQRIEREGDLTRYSTKSSGDGLYGAYSSFALVDNQGQLVNFQA